MDPLVCRWKNCSLRLPSTLELKNHIEKEHLGTNKGSYRCDWSGCNFGERRKIYDLKTHVTVHHQHHSYFCHTCNKGFLRDQELRKHHNIGCRSLDAAKPARSSRSPQSSQSSHSSPHSDNINHAPSPVSSEGGMEVPSREGSSEWSDAYVSDHSSPAEVPIYADSKKRQRGEVVEQFFDSFKREKIEPTPTIETLNFVVSANEIMDEDQEFLDNFDLNESFNFLQALKKNVESMPTSQLDSLLDDMYYGPLAEDLGPDVVDFSEGGEGSMQPILDSIESPQLQAAEQQAIYVESDTGLDYLNDEDPDEERQVPILTEQEQEVASHAPPPNSLHAVPSITSPFPSLASSVVFPAQKAGDNKFRSANYPSLHESLLSHRIPETPTLASLNARNLPSPSIGTTRTSCFPPPSSFISPGDLSPRRPKDVAAGSSFIPFIMGNSLLSSSSSHLSHHGAHGNAPQFRLASSVPTFSLYDRYSEKGVDDKSKKGRFSPLQEVNGVADMLQNLDFRDKDKEDSPLPPKPSLPSGLHARKGPEGLLPTPSPPVQPALRFSKQDVLGMIEKLLKRH